MLTVTTASPGATTFSIPSSTVTTFSSLDDHFKLENVVSKGATVAIKVATPISVEIFTFVLFK